MDTTKANKMYIDNLTNGINVLYHGGRGLEFGGHREILGNKKDAFEYGVGLYLTTSYMTARKYAKGGGKVYAITIHLEQKYNIFNIMGDIESVKHFVNQYCIKEFRPKIINDLTKHIIDGKVNVNYLVNLIINYRALQASKTVELRKFLISNGVKYSIEHNFRGASAQEDIVVVIDPTIIEHVAIVPASNNDYDRPRPVEV